MQDPSIKITRICSDEAGVSYFKDATIPMSLITAVEGTPPLYITQPTPATHLFSINPGNWQGDMHVAPHKQYVIILAGELEITTGKNETRRFKAGDIVLAEDTTGKGHETINPNSEPVICTVAQID